LITRRSIRVLFPAADDGNGCRLDSGCTDGGVEDGISQEEYSI
jgi:hypothetical protein